MDDGIESMACPAQLDWCTNHQRVVLNGGVADYHRSTPRRVANQLRAPRLQLVGGEEPATIRVIFEVAATRNDHDDEEGKSAFEQVCLWGPHLAVPMGIDPEVAEDLAAALMEAARTLRG